MAREFSRQFAQAHALAEEGDLPGAVDCFRDVPASAQEYDAALFNQGVLLARLGYLLDAECLFRALTDRGIDSAREIEACSEAKSRELRRPACVDVPLKLKEEGLAAHREIVRQQVAAGGARAISERKQERGESANVGKRWAGMFICSLLVSPLIWIAFFWVNQEHPGGDKAKELLALDCDWDVIRNSLLWLCIASLAPIVWLIEGFGAYGEAD